MAHGTRFTVSLIQSALSVCVLNTSQARVVNGHSCIGAASNGADLRAGNPQAWFPASQHVSSAALAWHTEVPSSSTAVALG